MPHTGEIFCAHTICSTLLEDWNGWAGRRGAEEASERSRGRGILATGNDSPSGCRQESSRGHPTLFSKPDPRNNKAIEQARVLPATAQAQEKKRRDAEDKAHSLVMVIRLHSFALDGAAVMEVLGCRVDSENLQRITMRCLG